MTAGRVFVTGASGFVGRALVARLVDRPGASVVAALRDASLPVPAPVERFASPDLSAAADWRGGLEGAETVYHLAARVHVMHDAAADPLAEFRRVNVEGTLELARQAARAGVRRFVFVSSIKVNGEETAAGRPFRADDAPAPLDPYGISKLEAEQGLQRIAGQTGLQVAIVRPPLVYGPGVKANFRRMMDWLRRGLPLPFGAVDNRRSLVALGNLVDLLIACGEHPAAAGQSFLVSDGEDLSTAQLLERLGAALERRARLVPIPPRWLERGFDFVGRRELARRLCGSLQVDIGAARTLLGWTPPVGVDEALRRTAAAYLEAEAASRRA